MSKSLSLDPHTPGPGTFFIFLDCCHMLFQPQEWLPHVLPISHLHIFTQPGKYYDPSNVSFLIESWFCLGLYPLLLRPWASAGWDPSSDTGGEPQEPNPNLAGDWFKHEQVTRCWSMFCDGWSAEEFLGKGFFFLKKEKLKKPHKSSKKKTDPSCSGCCCGHMWSLKWRPPSCNDEEASWRADAGNNRGRTEGAGRLPGWVIELTNLSIWPSWDEKEISKRGPPTHSAEDKKFVSLLRGKGS